MARSIDFITPAVKTLEGEGFVVRRPFPTPTIDQLDPFLLLDRMGPVTLAPGEAKGAPDHPHRGFETVTYVLDGAMEHEDSQGHTGRLGPGDVQWMTAGAGVVHSEMPALEMRRDGGRLHGFQLWLNLPRRDKMMAPRYQELPASSIPSASANGVTVRVLAGEALGVSARIDTRTPIAYLHVTLAPDATFTQPLPRDFNVFAFVFRGSLRTDRRDAREDDVIVFRRDGDDVTLTAGSSGAELLLIGGQPLNEPVARYGPFVMNSVGEIRQAMLDYQAGRMGEIAR